MLGGVFRKVGMYTAMGTIALRKIRLQLWKDNKMAIILAEKMSETSFIKIMYKVETNMVYFSFSDEKINIKNLQPFMKENGIKIN